MSTKQLVVGLVASVAAVAALLVGFALGRSDRESVGDGERTITVTGVGAVKAVPDIAEVSVGVLATAPTAQAARADSDAQMSRVLAALKARGVADADIQTSQVSLSPTFDRTGARVVGYTAANTVTARIRDLDASGEIITAVAGGGANQISGPTLIVSDEKRLYRKALEDAVADARVRAETIATAGGEKVGALRSATEGNNGGPTPYELRASDSAATPIEPGTVEVKATVTATFDID